MIMETQRFGGIFSASFIFAALFLVVALGADEQPAGDPEEETMRHVCDLAPEMGACKASLQKWFHNQTAAECQTFVYGGCKGNGNNFPSQADCENFCIYKNVTKLAEGGGVEVEGNAEELEEGKEPRKGAKNETEEGTGEGEGEETELYTGEILLSLPNEKPKEEFVDFESAPFGEWTAVGIELDEEVIPDEEGEGGGALNRAADVHDGHKDNYYAEPEYDMATPLENRTLTRTMNITETDFYEIEFKVRVLGFDIEKTEDPAEPNPFFALELIDDNKAEEGEPEEHPRVTLFDIKDYAEVFAKYEGWLNIKFVFNPELYVPGTSLLRFTMRRGNSEGSNVHLDDILFRWTSELSEELVQEMNKPEPTDPPPQPPQTTPKPQPPPEVTNATETTVPPPVSQPSEDTSLASTTTEIILIVLVVGLSLALVILGYKHWNLKQNMVGTYNMPASSTASAASTIRQAYDNPMYSGQQAAGSRGQQDRK